MKRGMVLYAVVTVGLAWLFGGLMYATRESLGQLSGLMMLPAMVIPLIMAYVAHRFSGAVGNPFAGLTWGNTSWYFMTWILALVFGLIALVAGLGLGLNRLDLNMSGYVDMIVQQSADRGNPIPGEARSYLKVSGYITAIFSPTLGAWLGGALGCLLTFPWLGWFYRRAMVYGRANGVMLVMVLFLATGLIGGLAENPMWGDTAVWQRVMLMAVASMAFVPGMVWIMLKTRSAVIPALAMYSYQNTLAGAMPFLTMENSFLSPPFGLLGSLFALAVGIGLWIWKDPGGQELAVAAVAHDGTPLTPQQVEQMDEKDLDAEPAAEAEPVRQGLVPPPPAPGEIEKLPPNPEESRPGGSDAG